MAAKTSKKAQAQAAAAETNGSEAGGKLSMLDRLKLVDDTIVRIERECGKGTVMRLGGDAVEPVDVIPTGSLALDKALGVGGLPRGRVVEIYGPESSGKTTLALHAVAQAQAAGGIAALIDAEHALDPAYAKKIGVNLDALLVSQPDSGEQGLVVAEKLVLTGQVDVIVVDSVAALVPRAELEGEIGDSHVGLQARMMSQALRKLTAVAARSNTLLIFINQLREKIGVMFGSPETTPGGRALKFYSSVRLDVRRIGSIKDGETVVGNRTKVTVQKNKVAPPFAKVEFDIIFAHGIDSIGELIDFGVQHNIIAKTGAWFAYGDAKLGQGRANARAFLLDPANADIRAEIHAKVLEQVFPEADPASVSAPTNLERATDEVDEMDDADEEAALAG